MSDDLKQIALDYFDKHPEAKELVKAKGRILFRPEIEASHHFEWNSKLQASVCWVCGLYWSDFNNWDFCKGFQRNEPVKVSMVEHIKAVLRSEEQLYRETINNCKELVLKRFKRLSDISGKDLANLHTTYGCDPETTEAIFEESISPTVRQEYERCIEDERELSRRSQKKEIITVNV